MESGDTLGRFCAVGELQSHRTALEGERLESGEISEAGGVTVYELGGGASIGRLSTLN